MDSFLSKTAKTYTKNLGKHVKRILLGQESVRKAAADISRDSEKLAREVKSSKKRGDHHRAARLVEKGRKAFNQKRYAAAESCFHKAILEDVQYALAYYYLGSAMYKQERLREATYYWTKAMEAEPGSEAALRAEQSLRRISMHKKDVIASLEERID